MFYVWCIQFACAIGYIHCYFTSRLHFLEHWHKPFLKKCWKRVPCDLGQDSVSKPQRLRLAKSCQLSQIFPTARACQNRKDTSVTCPFLNKTGNRITQLTNKHIYIYMFQRKTEVNKQGFVQALHFLFRAFLSWGYSISGFRAKQCQ